MMHASRRGCLVFALALALLSAGGSSNSIQWKIVGPGGGGSMFHPAISPHDPNLAVLTCDMTGAYITKDAGASWRQFNLRTTLGAFAFDPAHSDVLYAGSDGVFRSDDRGEKWRLVFPDPKTAEERMVGGSGHSRGSGRHRSRVCRDRVVGHSAALLHARRRADVARISHFWG